MFAQSHQTLHDTQILWLAWHLFRPQIDRQLPLVLVDTKVQHSGVSWKELRNWGSRTIPKRTFLGDPGSFMVSDPPLMAF
jgi:hypothetical protein